MRLPVSAPFHTSMFECAGNNLYKELRDVELNNMTIPVLTNVTGDYVESIDNIKEILRNQVMSSVKWEDTIRNMLKDGVDTFIEVGPGRALSGFVKKIDRKVTVLNVEDLKSLHKTVYTLQEEIKHGE